MNSITKQSALETAFASFKTSDSPNIFADSIEELCQAEIRRIHACSNANDAAHVLALNLPDPTPIKTFSYDSGNGLEIFEDGSLYEQSTGGSTVWAVAGDFRSERIGYDEPLTPGLREFFDEEEPEEPTHFRVAVQGHFYGPLTQEDWMRDGRGEVCEFPTKEAAEEAIAAEDADTYHLGYNESSRPTYIVCACE